MSTGTGIITPIAGSQRRQRSYRLMSIVHAIILGALVTFASACTSSEKASLPVLRIGIPQWPGFDVFLYGREAGLFQKRGLDIKLMHFDNQQDATRALLRGTLDVVFVSMWDMLQADSANSSPGFFLVTNISHGADGIIARPGITSMAELRGKRIGAKLGTVNQLILLEALRLHAIRPDEIEIVDVDNAIAERWMYEGRLDAIITWEPVLSKLAADTGGSILYTTRDVDSLVIDGMVARSQWLAEKPEALMRLVLVWFDIMHALETQPDKVYDSARKAADTDAATFARAYAGLKRGDRELNRRMFSEGRLSLVLAAHTELMRTYLPSEPLRTDVAIASELIMTALERWAPLSQDMQRDK